MPSNSTVMIPSNDETKVVETEEVKEEIDDDDDDDEIVEEEIVEEEYMEVTDDEIDEDEAEIIDDEGQEDLQDAFYFDEETVVEEETVMDDGSVYEEEILTDFVPASRRALMPLDEEHPVEMAHEIIEEELQEHDEDMEFEGEDADDESSAWIDDGRDYTKDPNAVAPRSFHFRDHFADDSVDDDKLDEDDDEAFYLDIPDIESVSSLEDLSGGEESQASSIVMEEIIDEGVESKRKLTERQPSSSTLEKSANSFDQSVDWEHGGPIAFGDDDDVEDMMSTGTTQEEIDELKDAFTAHSRVGLSLKRTQKETPIFCGRQLELERLWKALEAIEDPTERNPRRIVWIYGSSGIGKSALAEHFLCQLTMFSKDKKHFIGRGTFDERAPQIQKPYSALVDCLTEIVDQLMDDQADTETTWRDRIGEGLGKEARLLTMLIPNISKLLEFEEDLSDFENTFGLATGRLFDRLRFVIRRFLRIVCTHQKVVLFFDDLQWADEDSLRMIDTILSTHSLKNFFFIGCHRGVKRTHMLPRIKTRLASLSAADIMMKPIDKKVAKEIMVSFFKNEGPNVDMLTAEKLSLWVTEKSGGDPFHLEQLLCYLVHHEKLDKKGGKWSWDLKTLQRDQTIPSSAIDLVTERMKTLSLETNLVIKSAAFLGLRNFHLQSLYRAVQTCSSAETKSEDNPIQDVSVLVEHLEDAVEADMFEELSPGYYEFTHDTIKRAAFLLLPKSNIKKSSMHFDFASRLHKEVYPLPNDAPEKETMLLLVADHFSLATEDLKDVKVREDLARLNLGLAENAIRKASFGTAVRRIEYGLSLLDQKSRWRDNYDLTMKLHLELSRVRFCKGDFEAAKMFADVLLANSKTERDKIGTYELLIWLAVVRNQLDAAFRLVSLALKEVWDETPSDDVEEEVGSVREMLNSRADAELLMLPEITHNKTASKLVFLARLAEISWMRQDFLSQDLAALKMVSLTIRYGSSKFSSLSFALYGICLARRNLHKEAYRYGHLAEMTARPESPFDAQAITFHHYAIAYWRRPFQASLEPLRKSAVVAIESNDMENLSFRVGAFMSHALATGIQLNSGDGLFKRFREYSIAFGGRATWLATIPFRLMLKLRGEPLEPAEQGFEKYTDSRAMQHLIFFQMVHAVFMQDMAIADKLSNKLILKPEGVWLPVRGFMEGLIATSLARSSTGKTRVRHQRKAAKIIEVLGGWAKSGLKQVYHMANLVNVELRLLSTPDMNPTEASTLYENAITSANKAGFIHHEALANERAGILFHSQQEDELATKFLTRACELYKTWGANAKVRHIKKEFPHHLSLSDMHTSKLALNFDTSGPSLDFGESQIIHFSAQNDSAPSAGRTPASGRGRAPMQGGGVLEGRGRVAKLGQKTGRGYPLVRVPSGGHGRARGMIRLRSRGRGVAGSRVGTGTPPSDTSSRHTTPPPQPSQHGSDLKPVTEPPNMDDCQAVLDGESSKVRQEMEAPEVTGAAPQTFPKAKLIDRPTENDPVSATSASQQGKGDEDEVVKRDSSAESAMNMVSSAEQMAASNDKSTENGDESELSDQDPFQPSSHRSDLGVQSDHGPRYKDDKKDKKKKKRRKLKASSKKRDEEGEEDSDEDEGAPRPRSLHSGLDAFSHDAESIDVQSDHGPSAYKSESRKMKIKVSHSKKKKKEKKETKRRSKSSSKLVPESQTSVTVGDEAENTLGTIKKKSKAKMAEDQEKKGASKLKSVDSIQTDGVVATRKVPSRSKSDGSILAASQKSGSVDELASVEDEALIEKVGEHSRSQPGRSISLGGKLVKKLKKRSKSEKKSLSSRKLTEKEENAEKTTDERPDEEASKKTRKSTSGRGLMRTLSWSGKQKDKLDVSGKDDTKKEQTTNSTDSDPSREPENSEDKSETKSKKTPRRGGLMRSLSWTGKRSNKSEDAAGNDKNRDGGDEDSDGKAPARRSKSFSMGSENKGKKLSKLKRGKKSDIISGDGGVRKSKKGVVGKTGSKKTKEEK